MSTVITVLALLVSYVGNPLSMWLAVNRRPFGWWIVAATQLLFVAFAILSGDWRFGGQVACLVVGVYGVWKWQVRREHEPAIGHAADRQYEEIRRAARVGEIAGKTQAPACPMDGEPLAGRESALGVPTVFTHRDGFTHLDGTAALTVRDATRTAFNHTPKRSTIEVAEDAIAALNHYDRGQAQQLRDRLEATR